MPGNQPLAPVVSVLNMKGGVGKTTLTANVFRELFRRKRKNILLVDFDPQYNLTQLLLDAEQYDELREKQQTLWHVINPEEAPSIFDVSDNDHMQPDPIHGFVRRMKSLRNPELVKLDLLPGDFRTARINLMTEPASLRIRRQRFLRCINEARSVYELVVLDCNPSSSFMTRTAIEAATHILIPVRADRYSLLGIQMLTQYIEELPMLERSPTLMIVVNDVIRSKTANEVIGQLRSHTVYGPRTLAAMIYHSTLLVAKPGSVGFAVEQGLPHTTAVRQRLAAVADEIATEVRL